MSIDDEIKKAFTRHESDVRSRPGAWSDIEGRIGRSHRRRMIAAGLGAGLAAVAAIVAIPKIGSQQPQPILTSPPSASSRPTTAPSRPRVVAKIRASVFALAAGSDSLWGLESAAGGAKPASLIRIDPRTRNVVARIQVGYVPGAVAADSKAIWVTNGSGCRVVTCADASAPTFRFPQQNSVMKIDPATDRVVASLRVEGPQDVALGFGSVWVTTTGKATGGTVVLRIDPDSGQVVATIPLGGSKVEFAHVAVGDQSVLVTVSSAGSQFSEVAQIDPATNKSSSAARVMRGSTLPDVAAGFGSVWVTTPDQSTPSALFRFDENDNLNTSTIPLPDAAPIGLNAVTTGEGYVWAVSARGYLWKVDPATRKHADPTTIGATPPDPADAVVTGFSYVWVASGDGQIWQLSP